MKRMYIALAAMLLGVFMITGCSQKSDRANLAVSEETEANWGLDFSGEPAEEETEAAKTEEESEEEETESDTLLTEMADGSKLMTFSGISATASGSLNVRSAAGTDNDVLIGIDDGETVSVTGITDSDWARVEKNGITGYVAAQYLYGEDGTSFAGLYDRKSAEETTAETTEAETTQAESSQAESSDASVSGKKALTTGDINLRTGMGANYSAIGVVPRGSEVTVLEESSQWWWKISYDGKEGYVTTSYLSVTE